MRSAFYYLGLTDSIPDKYYLATDKVSAKIRDSRIVQVFENSGNLELGIRPREVEGTQQSEYTDMSECYWN